MIAYIKGIVAASGVGWVVVDVNGIGYRIYVPSGNKIDTVGQEVKYHTHMVVREDGIQFFGFANEDEMECFLALLGVAGVGPKVALTVVSHLQSEMLRSVIAGGDVNQLVKVPGVGKKTAQRILLELKDKLHGPTAAEVSSQQSSPHGLADDAVVALLSLGYAQTEAKDAVRKVQNINSVGDVSSLIKLALKELAPAN